MVITALRKEWSGFYVRLRIMTNVAIGIAVNACVFHLCTVMLTYAHSPSKEFKGIPCCTR
jgi:hypothetical protein